MQDIFYARHQKKMARIVLDNVDLSIKVKEKWLNLVHVDQLLLGTSRRYVNFFLLNFELAVDILNNNNFNLILVLYFFMMISVF